MSDRIGSPMARTTWNGPTFNESPYCEPTTLERLNVLTDAFLLNAGKGALLMNSVPEHRMYAAIIGGAFGALDADQNLRSKEETCRRNFLDDALHNPLKKKK